MYPELILPGAVPYRSPNDLHPAYSRRPISDRAPPPRRQNDRDVLDDNWASYLHSIGRTIEAKREKIRGLPTISGYACLYGETSTYATRSGQREMFLPGCFHGVDDNEAYATIGHDRDKMFAAVSDFSLFIESNETGLWFMAVLLPCAESTRIISAMKSGTCLGASFSGDGHRAKKHLACDGTKIIYSRIPKLHDISVCLDRGPKFPGTRSTLRLGTYRG